MLYLKAVLVGYKAWQEGSDFGKDHQQNRHDNQGHEKWYNTSKDPVQRNVGGDALDDKYVHAHRRRDNPHLAYEHNDDPKPDRVKAELQNYREENGDGNHNETHNIHEEAAYKVN